MYFYIGEIYKLQNKIHLAEINFKKALKFDFTYAEAHKQLGEIYRQQNQPEKADEHFNLAYMFKPSLRPEVVMTPKEQMKFRGSGPFAPVDITEKERYLIEWRKLKREWEKEREKEEQEKEMKLIEKIEQRRLEETVLSILIGKSKPLRVSLDFDLPNYIFVIDKDTVSMDKVFISVKKIPSVYIRFDPEGVFIEHRKEVSIGESFALEPETQEKVITVKEILPEENSVVISLRRF